MVFREYAENEGFLLTGILLAGIVFREYAFRQHDPSFCWHALCFVSMPKTMGFLLTGMAFLTQEASFCR